MEDVGFRKCCKGTSCTVKAPGVWTFFVRKGKEWAFDTARDTLLRDGIFLFAGVKTLADAVLLSHGYENCLTDLWEFAKCKELVRSDGVGRKHPAAKLIAYLKGEGK